MKEERTSDWTKEGVTLYVMQAVTGQGAPASSIPHQSTTSTQNDLPCPPLPSSRMQVTHVGEPQWEGKH